MNPEPSSPAGPEPEPVIGREPDTWTPPRRENAIVTWARAIALGIQDTAKDVLAEGRKGANDAYDEYWQRYDKKTRKRR